MTCNIFLNSLIIFSFCCKIPQKENNKSIDREITAFKISREFPIINNEGKIIRYDPFETKIYYYKNQILYQTYYYNSISNNLIEAQSPLYNYVYYSFIFSKNRKYGILYDSSNIEKAKVVPVDSILSKEWGNNLNFEYLFKESHTSLISSLYNSENENEKIYHFQALKDTTMKGEFQLSFSKNKLRNIDYSLSKEIDSLHGARLYKVVIVNYERTMKENNFHIDRIKIPYLLEEIPVTNKEELLKLFNLEKKLNYSEK